MKTLERGLHFAFISITLWGMLGIAYRFATVNLGADPFLFACLELFLGGALAYALAGKSSVGLAAFKSPYSWGIGLSRVASAACFLVAVATLTTVEVYFAIRVYVVLGLLAAWLFFRRPSSVHDLPAIALILLGVGYIITKGDLPWHHPAILGVLGVALAETCMSICTEKHPMLQNTSSARNHLKLTSAIMALTALLLFLGMMLLNWLGFRFAFFGYTPNFQTLLSVPLFFCALAIGFFLRTPALYTRLRAIQYAKTELVLAAAAVSPFLVLGVESFLDFFGILPMPHLTLGDIAAGALITLGSLLLIFIRLAKQKKAGKTHA